MAKDAAMLNSFNPDQSDVLSTSEQEMINRRKKLLGPSYRLFYETPLHIVKGSGVWLYDEKGNAYLDAYNNVASVGHCHPHVVEAIVKQVSTLNTHTRYLHEGILHYAEHLLSTFPQELSQVMFTCTGSEANDLALRVARQYTKGTGVIITQLAYHGITTTVSEISPSLGKSTFIGKDNRTILAPDTYRLGDSVSNVFAEQVQLAIDDMLRHGIQPAALIVDTIFSSDGVFVNPPGFLKSAVDTIHRAGGVFIADEVQAGFARTGSSMWGFQRHDVLPDIVTMGKPMGNGHPIAGMVAQPHIIRDFGEKRRYFNTFGGNPVSCAAAQATLEVIEQEGLLQNSSKIGRYLFDGFCALAKQYPIIGDVRGAGLFLGVELVKDQKNKIPDPEQAQRFVNAMRNRKVLISLTGVYGNVLKIRPLLAFKKENADLLLSVAEDVLKEIS